MKAIVLDTHKNIEIALLALIVLLGVANIVAASGLLS